MRRMFAAAAMLCVLSPAVAHDHGPGSWINHERLIDPVSKEWCCDLRDCQEEKNNVRALPDGNFLIISTGEIILFKRVIWRSPGSWWRCRRPDNATRCLIGPPPGS